METWLLNYNTARRCLIRKLTLKEINELNYKGIYDITEQNIIGICKNKNIELRLIKVGQNV